MLPRDSLLSLCYILRGKDRRHLEAAIYIDTYRQS